jgi:hypothetical protein
MLDTLISRSFAPSSVTTDPYALARFALRTEPVRSVSGADVPNARAVIREDTGVALACVGSRYVPIQSADAIELAHSLADGLGLGSARVQVLTGGADVVIEHKGEESKVGSDVLRRVVTVRTNNTGRAPLTASAGVWRKVCSNGLFLPIGRQTSIRIRHTASGADRVKMLGRMQRDIQASQETGTETILRLMARRIDHKGGELRDFYSQIMPTPAAADAGATIAQIREVQEETQRIMAIRRDWAGTFLRELDARDAGSADGPNAWLALNSVTNWAQHRMPIRGERQNRERRAYSNLPGGAGAELTERAWSVAAAMVN